MGGSPGQGRAGIHALLVNASSMASNSFTAFFLAVAIAERMTTKCPAPAVKRRHREIFRRSRLHRLCATPGFRLDSGWVLFINGRAGRCLRGLQPLEPANACLRGIRSSNSPTLVPGFFQWFSATIRDGARYINRGLLR